jgi:adenylate cyclase, class 2
VARCRRRTSRPIAGRKAQGVRVLTSPRKNIELKARCSDLFRAAEAAIALGATFSGTLHQTDTYFRVPSGRFKLRETDGKAAELIWYDRPDSSEFRDSEYYVLPIPEPAETKTALSKALGVKGEVRKRRDLYVWHNVRIHLDEVSGLGTFLEFEAVISAPDEQSPSHERLTRLAEALAIQASDRVPQSYSDLLGL